jgi:hypothetical protein
MLSGVQSSSDYTGWWLLQQIWQKFNIWVQHQGKSFADKAGGNNDLSDNLNAAAPYC